MSNKESNVNKTDSIESSEVVTQKSDISKEKENSEKFKSEDELADLDIEKLPQEAQAIIGMMMASRRRISSPMSDPLSDKISTEHISKMLDIAEKDNEREFENTKLSKQYNLVTLVIALIFLAFITVFLGNKDLSTYQDIV